MALPLLALTCVAGIPAARCFSPPSADRSSPPPPPPFEDPSTPEEAVQNQLHHYRTNELSRAFGCCSPSNREATGSLSEFERLVREPPYDLILGHERADVLLEVVPGDVPVNDEREDPRLVSCLVCVRPNGKARRRYPVWFWWEMSKVEEGSDEGASEGGDAGKWMVDCIMPDFEDLDFETEQLSIVNFMEEEDGDGDEVIYLDFDL